jgi:hypothetical protein
LPSQGFSSHIHLQIKEQQAQGASFLGFGIC